MSSQPAPMLAQAGSGHCRCPLQEEEEKRSGVRGENGGGGDMRILILT